MRAGGSGVAFGSAVVELLIPHRRPFLMVDAVDGFHRGPPVRLEAHRSITVNEPVFDGHFPGLPIWPGALTMEGLAQSGVLLLTLSRLAEEAEKNGSSADEVFEALANLDRRARLHPGHRPAPLPPALTKLQGSPVLAVGAAVDLKFTAPVTPGCRLDYVVELTHDLGDSVRFAAEASVDGRTVARGAITGALVPSPGGGGAGAPDRS